MIVFRTPPEVLVRTSDGRNFTVMEEIAFRTDLGIDYRVPVGATSDGASTPRGIWSAIPPFGTYWKAAVIHDSAYRGTLEQLTSGVWMPVFLTKDQADDLLLQCMVALGVDELIREEIFHGVSLAGWRAFNEDRKAVQ